jgi:hypothetical protein
MPRKATGKQVRDTTGTVLSVHGKSANGTGSVYQAKADGSWRATWRDTSGARRESRGTTQAEALARRGEAIARDAEEAKASRVPSRFTRLTTLTEFMAYWLEQQRHRVRESSHSKYTERVERINAGLGTIAVADLGAEQVGGFLSRLLDDLSPSSVGDIRATLRSVLRDAVRLGLAPRNVADDVAAPRVEAKQRRSLTAVESRALVEASRSTRYGAAVALLYMQGWRVSEVLGLCWADLDLDAGTALVQRAAIGVDGRGTVLAPTKTKGAQGLHHLAPLVVELLKERRAAQQVDRLAAGATWQAQTFEERAVEPVFTNDTGGLVIRQRLTKVIQSAAVRAGIDPTGIATHTGRRSVITSAYGEGLPLEDIAGFVGHASSDTTKGYVQHLGARPQRTSALIAALFAGEDPKPPRQKRAG